MNCLERVDFFLFDIPIFMWSGIKILSGIGDFESWIWFVLSIIGIVLSVAKRIYNRRKKRKTEDERTEGGSVS